MFATKENQASLRFLIDITPVVTSETDLKKWVSKLERDLESLGVPVEKTFVIDHDTKRGFAFTNNVIEKMITPTSGDVYTIIEASSYRASDKTVSLLDLLKKNYNNVVTLQEFIEQYNNISMQAIGNFCILSFSHKVISLAKNAGILGDSMIVTKILSGLTDEWDEKIDLQSRFLSNVEEWLITASKMKLVYGRDMSKKIFQSSLRIKEPKDPTPKTPNIAPHEAMTVTSVFENNCRANDSCYNCNGIGHHAYECTSPKAMRIPKRRTNNLTGIVTRRDNLHQTEQHDDYFDSNLLNQVNDDSLQAAIFHLSSGKKLHVPVYFRNSSASKQTSRGLIDCGATLTLIRPEHQSTRIRARITYVKYGNGFEEKLTRQSLVQFELGGLFFTHWAWVADNLPHDIVLGNDFLEGRANIDFIRHILTIQPKIRTKIEECYSSEIQTKANSLKVYQAKAIEKREKEHQHINSLPNMDPIIRSLCHEYIDKFWQLNKDSWKPADFPEYTIETISDDTPNERAYRTSQVESQYLRNKVLSWIEKGIARRSVSRYGAPALLVPKKQYEGIAKEDMMRACVNFKKLNSITVKSDYPLPYLEDIMDGAQGDIFSVLDGDDFYHQIAIAKRDQYKTGTNADGIHIEFTRVHYGLCNATHHAQWCMDNTYGEEPKIDNVKAFIDDSLMWSWGIVNHRSLFSKVLSRLLAHNIRPNFIKSQYALPKVEFGGRLLSKEGIALAKDKVKAVSDLAEPISYKLNETLIGLCLWHAPWIPKYADIMAPIHNIRRLGYLDKKDRPPFSFDEDAKKALVLVKNAIINACTRARSGPGEYHVYADKSKIGVGGHLVRLDPRGNEHLMGYFSHTFNKAELNYDTPKGELFAIYKGVKAFWWYLVGRSVHIHTDHQAWKDLNFKKLSGIEARWVERIGRLDPESAYIKGVKHVVADAFTRLIKVDPNAVMTIDERGVRTIPVEWRTALVQDYHQGVGAGHLATDSLYKNLSVKYWWDGMYSDCQRVYENCDDCQRHKKGPVENRNKLIPLPTPTKPWQVVCTR
jgi:hypothetical protein